VRVVPTLLVVMLLGLIVVAVARADPGVTVPEGDPAPSPPSVTLVVVNHDFELLTLRNKVKREHARYLQAHHRVKQLTRTLQHESSTREAVDLACSIYGSCSTLWRRMSCESGGYRFARNPSGASGLFQFLPSTWASTPFASFSIWSPYAQALAAGWMNSHGRGGEWVCR
jgi:hypothetical protein